MAERDAKKVAEGLTEAQRRVLNESVGQLALARNWPNRHKMFELGLALPTVGMMRIQLTDLGFAVRDHLRGEQ